MSSRRRFVAASLGALLLPAAAGASGPPRRRPYVQNVGPSGATLRWTTLRPGAATILVWDGDGWQREFACQTKEVSAATTGLSYGYFDHRAVITGLRPGAAYQYRISMDGAAVDLGPGLSFRTAGQGRCTFLVIGDTGVGSTEQEQLAQRMLTEQPALLIHTGDIAYPTGTYEAYEQRYFDFYHALMRRVPFYPCPGNHDYYETDAYPYLNVHDLPAGGEQGRYYSFDRGDIHFISLDSNDPLTEAAEGRGAMLRWLERDLAETRKFWRIAYLHHPPYAFGPNSGDAESAHVRAHVVPLLERYGVPLLLSGHEHSYQRTHAINGMVYVTSGGGGAQLYPVHGSRLLAAGESRHHYLRITVDGPRLRLQAVDAGGAVFDETSIAAAPLLAAQSVVNAASFDQRIGEGSWISIFGWQLAVDTLENGGRPLSREATGGVTVSAGGRELALLMVSPTQLNAILPEGLTGPAELDILTPAGRASVRIDVAALIPALFPAVIHADGAVNSPEAPCKPGATVTLFATGLLRYAGDVHVRVGGEVVAARLEAAGLPGLQVIRFEAPALAAGRHVLRVEAGIEVSNPVSLSIVQFREV